MIAAAVTATVVATAVAIRDLRTGTERLGRGVLVLVTAAAAGLWLQQRSSVETFGPGGLSDVAAVTFVVGCAFLLQRVVVGAVLRRREG